MKRLVKTSILITLFFILMFPTFVVTRKNVFSYAVNFSFRINSSFFQLNENTIKFSQRPIVRNGRVFIPIRDFLNALDIDYVWNGTEKSITFEFDGKRVKILLKEEVYLINDNKKHFNQKPFVFKNLTYISIRDLGEIFNLKINWNEKEKIVTLTGNIYPKIMVRDDLNNVVIFYEKPKRIISLAPSNTEILFALGLNKEIVGVTEFCDYPSEAKKKEKIGGFINPNLEKIYSLKPDLVLGVRGNPIDLFMNLKRLKINTLAFDPKNLDDLFNLILTIGKVVDKRDEAKNLVKNLNDMRMKIAEEARKLNKRRVYLEIWNSPYMSVGKNTYLNELIEEVGGINIASKAIGDWPILSQEFIVNENPEVIIIAYMGQTIDDVIKRPGWENIDAVKNRRVYILENQDLIFRLGPRIIDGMEELFRLIHKDKISLLSGEEFFSSLILK